MHYIVGTSSKSLLAAQDVPDLNYTTPTLELGGTKGLINEWSLPIINCGRLRTRPFSPEVSVELVSLDGIY